MVGGFLSSYWIAFQLKYICLYVYDTLGTMQDYLFQKCYLKALHCIGSLNLFWFCFEVIIAFGRSELSQLRGRYHYLIIQVLIYLRKSTFYRRVEEWNWWWSRVSLSFHIQLFTCVRTLLRFQSCFYFFYLAPKKLYLLLSALLSTYEICPINRYISTAIPIIMQMK